MNSKNIKDYRHKIVDIYKISVGCQNCGYNKHPSCLCFDHLPGEDKSEHVKNGYSKRSSAGGMYRLYSKKHKPSELIEEMKKCILLCHNCHMEKTHSSNERTRDKIEIYINSIEEVEKLLIEFESK
jgi:hypothetical protein